MIDEPNEVYVGNIPIFGPDYSFQSNGYTPKAAIPNVLYSGTTPVAQSYDKVEEPFDILVKGADSNEVVLNKRVLELALTTAMFSEPAILKFRGRNQSQAGYAEIYSAKLQEGPEFIGRENGANIIRLSGTWIRSPFFSAGTLGTILNAVTVTNSGTGANNNTRSLGTLTGDLTQEGQPLNVSLANAASPIGFKYAYLASVYQRLYTASAATRTTIAAAQLLNDVTLPGYLSPAKTRRGLRLRFMHRLTSSSAMARLQFALIGASGYTLWSGPWVKPGTTGATLVDLTPQGLSLDVIRRAQTDIGDLVLAVNIKSADGSSITVTSHSYEVLLYYTFCRCAASTNVAGSETLRVEQASNLNGGIWFPTRSVYTTWFDGSNQYFGDVVDVRGELPRAFDGASLWMSWVRSNFLHDNTDTVTATVKHLPLFRTMRGAI